MRLDLTREELIALLSAIDGQITARRALLTDTRLGARQLEPGARQMLRDSLDSLDSLKERVSALLSTPRQIEQTPE